MLPNATLHRLANGLRVVFINNDNAESVSFGIFVSSGSRHESAADAGISHFIEHMLFKGTKKRSALKISQAIEGRGGSFNAYTSEESTCFYAHLPCEALEPAVDILTDMYINAAIPEEEFERERYVILEEIKMYEDEPDAVASENLSKCLFPGNPLGLPVAGSGETLGAITPQHMRDYIRRVYVPAATVAVVSGRFNPVKAMALIEKTLGALPTGEPPVYEKMNLRKRVIGEMRAKRDINQVQLALGYRIFGIHDSRKYAANVFDCLMGRSMSSRLFQAVREKRGLSYDIGSNLRFFSDTGGWTVTGGVDSKRADEALAAVEVEIDRIRTKKVSGAELRRTKEYLLGNYRLSFERPQAGMFYFGGSVLTNDKIVSIEETVEQIEAVGAGDILSVAQAMLDDRNKAVSWVVPK